MDFSFSDEQNEIRDLARKILEDRVTNERLKQLEAREETHDAELWQELAKAGLLGVAVPEAQGGMGFGFFEQCLFLQETGRAVAPVPAYALALGALPLAAFGSEEQKQAWLPGLAEGRTLLTAALVELDAADPMQVATTAKSAGADAWRLEGTKSLVPAAERADRIFVPARCEDGRIGIFAVDPEGEGVELVRLACSDRQPYSELRLTGAPVKAADLLGGVGGSLDDGAAILKWLLDRASVALCALQLGVSERALQMTAEYTTERRQFDRPVGSFQAVHQRAADAYVNLEAIRLTTWEAAWRLADGRECDDAIAMAKYWCADGGHQIAYAAQHLHGGIGLDMDYPLHRYFIWTTQIEHSLGAGRAQLARLGTRIAERGIPAG